MRRALNSPLSPHSVGLITTSFSLLQPLRKRRTLRKQNALATNMAFLNCNSVTDSAPRRVLGFRSPDFRLWWRQICPLAVSGPFFLDPSSSEERQQLEAFQKKVYLGEKTLTELSYFHVLYF